MAINMKKKTNPRTNPIAIFGENVVENSSEVIVLIHFSILHYEFLLQSFQNNDRFHV
jgi:hypothetical protein